MESSNNKGWSVAMQWFASFYINYSKCLKHNFDGTYGGKVYEDFNPDMLFDILGIEPNWKKINYFLLLDELF